MDSVRTYYEGLITQCSDNFNKLLDDDSVAAGFISAHNFLEELETMHQGIGDHYSAECFRHAIIEYSFSLFQLSIGSYRSAFSSLRLSFELALATIKFSASEFDYLQWSQGNKDINWNSIVEAELGIFSKQFIRVFYNSLEDEGGHFCSLARTVYRECSEYVHGNPSTREQDEVAFTFAADRTKKWTEIADTMHLVIVFCYAMRILHQLSDEKLQTVEQLIMDKLSSIESVRVVFSREKINGI